MPLVKCFRRKIRTPAELDKHLQDFDFPESSAEILFSECAMCCTVCRLRRFYTLFHLHTFLKNKATLSNQRVFPVFLLINNSPAKAVSACVYTKYSLFHNILF